MTASIISHLVVVMDGPTSERIIRNKPFLSLLLTTNAKQQLSLLKSITPDQLDSVGEVLHNIFHVVPLTREEGKFIKKRRKTIEKLIILSRSVKFRKTLLIKYKTQLLKTLLHFKAKLLSVLGG